MVSFLSFVLSLDLLPVLCLESWSDFGQLSEAMFPFLSFVWSLGILPVLRLQSWFPLCSLEIGLFLVFRLKIWSLSSLRLES